MGVCVWDGREAIERGSCETLRFVVGIVGVEIVRELCA